MTFKTILKNNPFICFYRKKRKDFNQKKLNALSDEDFIRLIYLRKFGREINLDNPKTYNEKLQWLKLYYHNPLYTKLVDKYAVKEYIADIIGEKYVIPTLGVWKHFDEIDFEKLPDCFVLKCNHGSGDAVIVKDKTSFDKALARKKIEASLRNNYYILSREWPYKNISPRIIAEPYLEDSKTKELRDYKFFCFNGDVKAMFVATDRQKQGEEVKFDYFDAEYNHLPLLQEHENASVAPEKPLNFEEMKQIASKLSKGFPEARIDLYDVNGKVYFGEITFFHFGGFMPFVPEKWDYTFGSWIELPDKMV